MTAKAQGGETVTVIVETTGRSVWLSIVPFYERLAILEPDSVDRLVTTLVQAAREVRGGAGREP